MEKLKERILITGATGFVGSRLAPRLEELGYDVYCLHRYVTGRYVQGRNIKNVFADLKDEHAVRQAVREVHPDRVINLAAISPVAYSYDHPQEVTYVNYIGSINLAESCLREVPNFKQFITAGTSEEYGNQPKFPITEKQEPNPNSPYAVAKNATTKYLLYMKQAYRFPVTILRPFNTYGRTDNIHFVTERIITQMLQGNGVRLGDPMPIRDFLYVDDHVEGYVKALGCADAIGEVINICTGVGYRIHEWADIIAELTGFRGEVEWNTIPTRPLDIDELWGDNRKAARLLGWQPTVDAKAGLTRTINYLRTQIKP